MACEPRSTSRSRREHAPHGRGLLQGRGASAAPGHQARRHRAPQHQGGPLRSHSRNDVVIVDSGGANIASLRGAIERLGARTRLSADGSVIASADRVVLPGVGAAPHAMERLRTAGLTNVLRTLTQPVLVVFLGMQLLFAPSDEGSTPCLAIVTSAVL